MTNSLIVTWDTTFFAGEAQDDEITISARWSPSNANIMSVTARAGDGYVPFTFTESFLRGANSAKTIRMVLSYDEATDDPKETEGPRVYVVRDDITVVEHVERPGRKGVHPAAIAVPVVVGLIAVALGFFCLWKKNKDKIVLSRIRRRSSQGYGVSKSRTQRMVAEEGAVGTKDGDIKLQESPVSPRSEGRNVFQEELRRQETGGRF